jgi:hypothetical protein
MQPLVSDEVWNRLDPRAGALSRPLRRRLSAAITTAAVVLGAGLVVDYSGVVRPHLDRSGVGMSGVAMLNPKVIAQEFGVRNNGWTTVRVVGIGQSGPGLRLLAPTDPDLRGSGISGKQPPFDLHPGQTVEIAVAYLVTDCAAVTADPFPVAVRVDRPWGTQTIHIPLSQSYDGPNGVASNPTMTEWQKDMADRSCGVPLH